MFAGTAALWLVGLLVAQAPIESPLPKFTPDQLLIVPVDVHLLQSEHSSAVHTSLDPKDIDRIAAKANKIWSQAGIVLDFRSVERIKAQNDTELPPPPLRSSGVRNLRPKETRTTMALHVFYVRSLDVNGIFTSRDGIFVQQEARLRMVPGGIDEPLPRVTSHEIGHALGLPHRQDMTNLMASGTTGTSLNAEEVSISRSSAEKWKDVQSIERYLSEIGNQTKAEVMRRAQLVLKLVESGPLREKAEALLKARAETKDPSR